MSMLKEWFAKFAAATTKMQDGKGDPKELEQLLESFPPEEPQADRQAGVPAPPDGDRVDALADMQAQLEQLRKADGEKSKVIEQLRDAQRRDTAKTLVDELVSGGFLPPALRVKTFALVEQLAGLETEVEVLADDGKTTEKKTGLALLMDVLKGSGPTAVSATAKGLVWQGADADLGKPKPVDEKALDEVAARTGGVRLAAG